MARVDLPLLGNEGVHCKMEPFASLSVWAWGLALLATIVVIWVSTLLTDRLRHLEHINRTTGPETFLEDPTSVKKVPLPSSFSDATKYLSIVIPAMNEEARLPLYLEEIMRFLQRRGKEDKDFTYEVIVVDDGSRDNTVKETFKYVKMYTLDVVRVIKLGVNQGKGAAVRKGMMAARGQLVLFADADGATVINDLEKLEREILGLYQAKQQPGTGKNVGDFPAMAVGSRAHMEKEAIAKRKWYRNFLMHGFHFCVLLVAGSVVRDTQCGFKMFTRAAVRKLFPNQRLRRWCFDVELIYLAKRQRVPIKEVAVNWTEIPGSKLKPTSILHMLFELALIRLGYGLGIWRVRSATTQQ